MEREFKGIWIPAEIWLDRKLSIVEKCLLVEIDSLDNDEGCFASNEYFAEFFDLKPTRISQMISKLKDSGYIKLESFDGRKRILRSNIFMSLNSALQNTKPSVINPDTSALQKTKRSFTQDCKDNNTVNNQTNNTYIQIPMDWPAKEFMDKWYVFQVIRKKKKKPIEPEAMKLIVDDLVKFSGGEWAKARKIMDYSIRGSYSDFYPLKEQQNEEIKDDSRYDPDKY